MHELRSCPRRVFFICASNNIRRIPQPLLSRMKPITFMGYNKEEKLNILQNSIIPNKVREIIGDNSVAIESCCQAIKAELFELNDRPLLNNEGGLRELERPPPLLCKGGGMHPPIGFANGGTRPCSCTPPLLRPCSFF
nr:hypothetical protein [Morchella crassipes]